MKLNENYYDLSNKNLWFDNTFEVIPTNAGDDGGTPIYPFNKPLDNSIAYAMTKGKYSPFCDWRYVALQGYVYNVNNQAAYGVHIYNYSNPCNYLFLATYQNYLSEPDYRDIPSYQMSWGGDCGFPNGISVGMNDYVLYNSFASKPKESEKTSGVYLNWGYDNPNTSVYPYSGSLCSAFKYNDTIMLVTVIGYNEDFTETSRAHFDKYDFEKYPHICIVYYDLLYPIGNNNGRRYRDTNFVICSKYEGAVPLINNFANIFSEGIAETEKGFIYAGFTSRILSGGEIDYQRKSISHSRGNIDRLPFFSKIHTDIFNYAKNILYYEITKEELEKVISCCGLFWTGDEDTAKVSVLGAECDSDLVRMPIQDDDGFFTGNFVTGENIKKYSNSTWGDDGIYSWYENNGVVGTPDLNTYVTETPLNTPNLTPLNTFNRTFALNKNDVKNLSNYLWNSDENIFKQIVNGLALMGENPMNSLIDLRLYPFDTRLLFSNNLEENIVLGRVPTNITALRVDENKSIIHLGDCEYPKYFKNFLDYEPFSYAELVIPYFGKISITPSEYCGHKISVKLVIDFTTGSAMACIFSDGILKEQKNGVVGVEISLTSDNSAQIASNFLNVFSNSVNASSSFTSNVLSGVSSGNPISTAGTTISGIGGVVSHNIDSYQNFFKPTPIQNTGCNTPTCSLFSPQFCYLIIHSPIIKEPENYKKSIGYACEYTSKLKDLNGFTICHNVNFDGGFFGTDEETAEIKRLLESGVYL